ncbi:hypothetical protein BOTBODRAFT_33982 [Botryobasidium botryosum FD-172 SS1]|uniref:Uncharacterized protein n=1 Tax=Botryobasidium botryosum (strain FD-172 SS1) TaxID=930990 RepID=A0A067MLW7_BOTB1|nr:hypothetical protein BOTBODRAFT_33982 [Botryobasidium botryosum FD-172 SS1]
MPSFHFVGLPPLMVDLALPRGFISSKKSSSSSPSLSSTGASATSGGAGAFGSLG